MKNFTILCLIVVSVLTTNAQSFIWAGQFETSGASEGRAVHYSNYTKSFLYNLGSFQGTIDLDPGVGTSSVSSKGADDIFISKLDYFGNFVWGLTIGGTNNDIGNSICEDRLGNIYICGYFSASVDFDPGPGTFNLTSAGGMDAFLLKLDAATGNFVWARQFEGTDLQTATAVITDNMGNVYTTGIFAGACDFDPGTGTFLLTETGGPGNAFICKLNPTGNFVWAKELGTNGSSKEAGNSISRDNNGNIITTGYFDGTIDLDPSPATSTVTSQGGNDIYILKLNSAGNFIWGKTIGSSFDDEGRSIKTDQPGDVYISGYFGGTADFDPGAGTYTLNTIGNSDIFILKLNATGNFVWAKTMGSTGSDSGNGLTIDGNGKLYFTGYFTGTVDFDPGAGSFNLSSVGNEDVFVSTLDTTGKFLSAKAWGGSFSDYGNGIATDGYGLMFTSGTFDGMVDFDPDATTFNLNALGNQEAFIHKMCNLTVRAATSHSVLCAGQTATLSSEGAGFFNWSPAIIITTTLTATPMTTTIYTLTGSYAGCINTDTVRITVNPLPNIIASASPSIICTGHSSSLTASGATSYTWASGENTPAIVVSPTSSIAYQVSGTSPAGCSNMQTVAVTVSPCTGVEEMTNAEEISIYPNPANDYVNIAVPANLASGNTSIEVRDALGKVVIRESINTDVTTLRITELKDGIYFFKVISNNQTVKVGKVVKH